MRALITGGAGFLGSHLCERLLRDGHDVICLDNLFTGSKSNVSHLMKNPKFEFLRHDVIDPFKVEVERIYNLACPASPPHYQFNPIKTVKTSVMGTINCLGLAKRVKARMLQASTSEVYGDPTEHPRPRATEAMSIRSDCVPVTMRASGVLKPCALTIIERTGSIFEWSESSIPTDLAWIRVTGG